MVALPESEGDDVPAYDPTPDEIRDRSKAIRKQWSPRTRKRRRVSGEDGWTVPTIELSDVAVNMSSPSDS